MRLLALLALPLFALNSRALSGGPPHLAWRIAGVGAFAFFLWISLCLWARLAGPAGLGWAEHEYTSLFLISPNDLTPLRAGTHEPLPMLLASCNLALTIWLCVCVAWLLVRHEREGLAKVSTTARTTARPARARDLPSDLPSDLPCLPCDLPCDLPRDLPRAGAQAGAAARRARGRSDGRSDGRSQGRSHGRSHGR